MPIPILVRMTQRVNNTLKVSTFASVKVSDFVEALQVHGMAITEEFIRKKLQAWMDSNGWSMSYVNEDPTVLIKKKG